MNLFLCYPKCSTCQKAKAILDEKGIDYQIRDIKLDNPLNFELTSWIKKSGLPVTKFFNTSGIIYREMDLKNKLAKLSEKEQIELLSQNGMLVKRPILILEDKVIVGFNRKEYDIL